MYLSPEVSDLHDLFRSVNIPGGLFDVILLISGREPDSNNPLSSTVARPWKMLLISL